MAWIERKNKKAELIRTVKTLKRQVVLVRGARQVGKTSFILNALQELADFPRLHMNLALRRDRTVAGIHYYGRDFFGDRDDAEPLLRNIQLTIGPLARLAHPLILFLDEADQHPPALEAIQALAELSDHLKVMYTGSNLENVSAKNAATGRRCYFDLYPITFRDFVAGYGKTAETHYLETVTWDPRTHSEHYHHSLTELFQTYLRVGGMPRLLDAVISATEIPQLPTMAADLVTSIEENVKSVLGDKSRLYEYEDVLRTLALLSMETLKFSRLQVQHAGRAEAKRLVGKTVGARVAHKIRLFDDTADLSKYILFDVGVVNYLLNGSHLLRQQIVQKHLAIQYETVVGTELIAGLPAREDLRYWKSPRGAQVEYLLTAPKLIAIDVKTARGDTRSLDSCAVFEPEVEHLVKIRAGSPRYLPNHQAAIPATGQSRPVALSILPHYLAGRVMELTQLLA